MSFDLAGLWSALEESLPAGERLAARLATTELIKHRGMYCAIDSYRRRHLLILLSPEDESLSDSQSRGLVVNTRELAIPNQIASNYIDIECRDSTGYAAFDLIGAELGRELLTSEETPVEVTRRVIAKWRRFWGQSPRQLLSREEQLGLFAELWFLSRWLFPKVGFEVVNSWHGPWGARHDFDLPDQSIEVKASSSERGQVHHIHGLDQLEPNQNAPLFLFSLKVREEVNGSYNLPKIIQECREALAADANAEGQFESALIQAGYSPTQEKDYAEFSLHIEKEVLFQVRDDFPRLTQASFPTGLPPGIERVHYEVNLNTFKHLIVAEHPDSWVVLGGVKGLFN